MRSLFLLAALCCLVLSACGSPIARSEEQDKEVARQSGAVAPAAPAAAGDDEDDDDDDDDDEDLDIDDALSADDDDDDDDDDDEDDEEADDDDDDEDYLERFFDDILGEDEDDDDDEPSAVQPVVAPADTVAAAPAAPVVEEAAAAAEETEEAEAEGDVEPEAGQKEPASAEVEAPAAEVAPEADAEEDDDEEDDIADALDPEEDEDDDEEEDDDDDDDDITDALGRNISTKHPRALTDEPPKKQPVPAIYIVKYNRFIDNILEKMNDILRQSYDPVSVKLQPIDANKKTSKPKDKNKKKNTKRKSSNKKKSNGRAGSSDKNKDKKKQIETATAIAKEKKFEDDVKFEELKKVMDYTQNETVESRAVKEKIENTKAKPTTVKTKPPTKASKPKPKPPVKSTTKKPVTKNKVKTSEKNKPRAKGTLYGLSSLRRVGDVAVNILAEHTTVKSNFAVGPLILRVEKEVGRGAKKEIKSATATTAEMTGKITLRVNNQGVATLHSIKVLQPKQVNVDSNHERTRELVWRRSARIAHVVSEKLRSASKPMFYHQSDMRQ